MCLSSATFSGKSLELRDPVRGAGMGGANGLCTEPGGGGGGGGGAGKDMCMSSKYGRKSCTIVLSA